ncbi:hypothetical protein ACFQYP_15585 [Nonomuraea antimicrobica]
MATLVFFVAVALACGVRNPWNGPIPSRCSSERSCWSDVAGR